MMEREFNISEQLEELARSSNRFHLLLSLKSIISSNTEVFTSFGLGEEEIEDQLDKCELAKLKSERFYKRKPKYHIIHDIIDDIYTDVVNVDTCDPDLIFYNIAVVLFVVLMAGVCV
ncbi:hypothetical protein [Succinivibrio sp.]|uniref:hypothetical protein n=1 Tax=Succinivibrio sp. TaxID=2053619 RepID=UPI0025F2785C|nr:hypothetical protein [Succinivibrio sp.]MBQ9221988.1 hypothetical protein [Succinivibrio sp.]